MVRNTLYLREIEGIVAPFTSAIHLPINSIPDCYIAQSHSGNQRRPAAYSTARQAARYKAQMASSALAGKWDSLGSPHLLACPSLRDIDAGGNR